MIKTFWGSLALAVCFSATGCAPALLPVAEQNGDIDLQNRIVTKKFGGTRVSIQTQEWRFNPTDLEQYYTAFLFLIRNESDKSIELSLKNIAMVDVRGNQSMPVAPREIEKEYYDRGIGPPGSGYFSFGSGGRSSMFGLGVQVPIGSSPPILDVSILSLHEGGIVPGAQIRGFVYFRKVLPEDEPFLLHLEFNQSGEDFHFIRKR